MVQVFNNKGVFQGSPISAMLFIIYFDRLLGKYKIKLRDDFALEQPSLTIRNEHAEHKWCCAKEIARFRIKGERKVRNPVLLETWTTETLNDTRTHMRMILR